MHCAQCRRTALQGFSLEGLDLNDVSWLILRQTLVEAMHADQKSRRFFNSISDSLRHGIPLPEAPDVSVLVDGTHLMVRLVLEFDGPFASEYEKHLAIARRVDDVSTNPVDRVG